MGAPAWLWLGMAANAVLLLPAFYMAISAVQVVAASDESPAAVGIASLFFALPVFCIAASLAAWRSFSRHGFTVHAGLLLAAPFVYAAFLAAFLFAG